MLSYLHSSRLQELDQMGERLVGGKIYTFELHTTTNKVSYKDIEGQTPQTNPIILDAYGCADMYLLGSYTLAVYDSNDVLLYTTDIKGGENDQIETGSTGTFAQNQIVSVNNYASVRSLNVPYSLIYVQGRETQADNGQGLFYLDQSSTEPDDDGIVLQSNNTGRYIRYNVLTVNPSWFGLTYDTITSQAVYLSAASTAAIRVGKPVEITGNVYINSNFITSANVIFTDNSKLVSTLPITASFYSNVEGAKDIFGNSVQPKFYANEVVKYSWMDSSNVEGKVAKLLACSDNECVIHFDEDISTTSSIIIPNNFTFRSNNTITFATNSPMNLTIPKIEKVYDNVFKFQAISTVGQISIVDEITPEFFSGIGYGADDTIPVQAALRSGNIVLTKSFISSGAHITTEPISIRSEDPKKETMPELTLTSIAFSTLLLNNISLNSSLNGNNLNANNVRMVCDGTCNNVVLNDVEYLSGKIITQESDLNDVVYRGSTVPCSKIQKLTNSQFANCLMSGSDKIEGLVSNVTITPTSANSLIVKDSIINNLYYNDSSNTFKPVLVLSGNNIINNSNFYAKNYKMLCQGNSSSATFNSCTFSDKITVSEASNKYFLNGCQGGSLEVNGVRDSVKYDTKIFTSGVITDSTSNWFFKNSGEIDDLDVIDLSVEGNSFVFNQAYYFDSVYSPNSVINGNSVDTDKVYTYTYVPGFSADIDNFIRFGGRLKVGVKNSGNSYFKICVCSPEYRIQKGGEEVGLTTSAESLWSGTSHKLLHETGILSNASSNMVYTEFAYQVNQASFRPVLEDFAVPTGYPALLTDHLGIRADILSSSATTNFYTNCDIYFVGFVDAGTEVEINWIAEVPKNDETFHTYFKTTSAANDTYLIASETYLGNPYMSSGTNNISDKWIFNTSYSSFGDKVIMQGTNPTKMTSANMLSAGTYPLFRNGYFVNLDYWKWMRNCYSNRLDALIPNLLKNDLEIKVESVFDKDNLTNVVDEIVKPISATRFYKSTKTFS